MATELPRFVSIEHLEDRFALEYVARHKDVVVLPWEAGAFVALRLHMTASVACITFAAGQRLSLIHI